MFWNKILIYQSLLRLNIDNENVLKKITIITSEINNKKGSIKSMFENNNQEPVVEETMENSENQNTEMASTDKVSSPTAEAIAENIDYLNPELFKTFVFNSNNKLTDSNLEKLHDP